jgi:hypothetical protein
LRRGYINGVRGHGQDWCRDASRSGVHQKASKLEHLLNAFRWLAPQRCGPMWRLAPILEKA